jgi:hypothetical protein
MVWKRNPVTRIQYEHLKIHFSCLIIKTINPPVASSSKQSAAVNHIDAIGSFTPRFSSKSFYYLLPVFLDLI